MAVLRGIGGVAAVLLHGGDEHVALAELRPATRGKDDRRTSMRRGSAPNPQSEGVFHCRGVGSDSGRRVFVGSGQADLCTITWPRTRQSSWGGRGRRATRVGVVARGSAGQLTCELGSWLAREKAVGSGDGLPVCCRCFDDATSLTRDPRLDCRATWHAYRCEVPIGAAGRVGPGQLGPVAAGPCR